VGTKWAEKQLVGRTAHKPSGDRHKLQRTNGNNGLGGGFAELSGKEEGGAISGKRELAVGKGNYKARQKREGTKKSKLHHVWGKTW